jgi:hypothetical protein
MLQFISLHSFWNGNQRYLGESCNQIDSCRNDLFGLQCTVYNICLSKNKKTTHELRLNLIFFY